MVDQRIDGEIDEETKNAVTRPLVHVLVLMTGKTLRTMIPTPLDQNQNDIVAVLGQTRAHPDRHAPRVPHTEDQHIEMAGTGEKIGVAVVARHVVVDAVASGPMRPLYAAGVTGDPITLPMGAISFQGVRAPRRTLILADLGHRAQAVAQ